MGHIKKECYSLLAIAEGLRNMIKNILGAANDVLFNEYLSAKGDMVALRIEHWTEHEFLSAQWFGLIIMAIIFVSVWWRLLDKSRLMEILLFGFFIVITAGLLDGFGTEFNAWEYPVKILPAVFPLVVIDLFILPTVLMLLYQHFGQWQPFLVAIIIASAIFSFIVEPIFQYFGLYKIYTWKYYYSFPIYMLVGLFSKWLMQVIILKQKKERDLL